MQNLKVKGQKSIFQANGKEKLADVAILILDSTDLCMEIIKRDKEEDYIMTKVSIQQGEISIANAYASDARALAMD